MPGRLQRRSAIHRQGERLVGEQGMTAKRRASSRLGLAQDLRVFTPGASGPVSWDDPPHTLHLRAVRAVRRRPS
jgi:hypothetical protein